MFRRLKLFMEALKTVRAVKNGANLDEEVNAVLRRQGAEVRQNFAPVNAEAQELLLEPDFEKLYPDEFKLTAEYIAIIRRMRLTWNTTEVGAPQCQPTQSFAGGTVINLLREELGDISDLEVAEFMNSLPAALNIFFDTAKFSPGNYTLKNMDEELLTRNDEVMSKLGAQSAISPDMQVEITKDDIALARGSIWDFPDELDMYPAFEVGEIAGPIVDPKRPYGDMTFYPLDVHRLLKWPTESFNEDGFIELTNEQCETAERLHFRQLGVMQAFLENGKIEPHV